MTCGLDAALIRNISANLSRSHKSKVTLAETNQILKGLRNKAYQKVLAGITFSVVENPRETWYTST